AVKWRRQGRDHPEVKVVSGIDRSGALEIANGRHERIERIEAQSVLRHAKVRGELLDVEIVSGFESAESRDRLHLCTEIESSQRGAIETDTPRGNEVVRGARDIQVGRNHAGRELGAVGNVHADSRQ